MVLLPYLFGAMARFGTLVKSMSTDDASDDTKTKLEVHLAECALRYNNMSECLARGERMMNRLQLLIGLLAVMVLLGPGFAAELIKKLIGG